VRIRRLDLKAFGPFTAIDLDLEGGDGVVNILFGENEAGKSSALRALEGFCFGIPDRSTDDHLHNKDQMRVGALLELADGTKGEFVRRKGKKNTLTDATNATVPDELFERFLCGVSRSGFEALFCLSYQRLNEASKTILEENGELGKLLFEARSDLSLRTIQATLSKRADDLFKGTPRSPAVIDKALAEVESYRKVLRKGDLAEYKEVQSKQTDLQSRKADAEKDRDEYRAQSARLHRHLSAIPLVYRLNAAKAGLADLGALPALPADFVSEFRKAKDARLAATTSVTTAANGIAAIEGRLSQISPDTNLLRWAGEIERLNTQVEQISKHQLDEPKEERKAHEAMAQARSALSRVRPGEEPDEENLRIEVGRNRIPSLGREKASLDQQRLGAHKEISGIERRLQSAKDQLQQTASVEVSPALTAALRIGRANQTAEADLRTREKKVQALEAACDQAASRLGSRGRSLLEFVKSEVPTRAVRQRFEDELRQNEDEVARILKAISESKAEERSAQAELDLLVQAGDVPTESHLHDARGVRDLQWQAIKNNASAPDPQPLLEMDAAKFEWSVEHADELSDRMRKYADEVAKIAAIEARIQGAQKRNEAAQSALADAEEAKRQVQTQWAERWLGASVPVDPPRQMADWMDRFDQLGADVLDLQNLKGEIVEIKESLETARRHLLTALGRIDDGASLVDLLSVAESQAAEVQRSQGSLQALKTQIKEDESNLKERRAQLEQIDGDVATWQAQWSTETACLQLQRVPTPDEADIALKAIVEAGEFLRIARIAEKRVQGMRSDIQEFQTAAHAVVESVAPDLMAMPPLAAIQNLYGILKEAERQSATQSTLQVQLGDLRQSAELANRQLQSSISALTALCERAGCSEIEELESVADRHAEALRFRTTIRTVTDELAEISPGVPVESLCAEVEPLDKETLQGQLQDIGVEIERLDQELEGINQQIGEQRTKLAALDNGRAQVETQRLAESALSRVRTAVRPYLVYTLAESLIRAQIEEFRRANQRPILRRAGEIFSVLTDGSFVELTADLDDNDRPLLAAVRYSRLTGAEERLKVDGLSSATRMGLYLALRLACLYHHLDQREGIPFVADDILLDFDDARARRVMEELGCLAQRTQVILFTHHKHLVEIGKQVLGERCRVQSLERK